MMRAWKAAMAVVAVAAAGRATHTARRRRDVSPRPARERQSNSWACSEVTQPPRRRALLRAIVFERNGARQLRAWVAHMARALRYDELVLIDHNGANEETIQVLRDATVKGAHRWRCDGPFLFKAAMWSHVARAYNATS